MTDLNKILDSIEKRPGMYFAVSKENYLDCLDSFMMGYSIGKYGNLDHFYCGVEFSEWLIDKKKLKGAKNLAWTGILRLSYPDVEESFSRFFVYYREYRNK
jgi:hypothetical protein